MESATPAISLIVVAYNQGAHLPVLFSCLERQDCPVSYEVLVCDDGSADDTYERVRSYQRASGREIRYIWQPDLGFRVAQSRNNGISCARGDVLIFIHADSILETFFLRDHWEAHSTDARLVYGGRTIVHARDADALLTSDDKSQVPGVSDLEAQRSWLPTNRPWMACLSVNLSIRKRDAILFDEAFNGWGSEDRDFAYRAWRNGLAIHVLPRTGLFEIDSGAQEAWHPWRGGGHDAIVAMLASKLHLSHKYPGKLMASSMELVRWCHLDAATNRWYVQEPDEDRTPACVLAEFTKWNALRAAPSPGVVTGANSDTASQSAPAATPLTRPGHIPTSSARATRDGV